MKRRWSASGWPGPKVRGTSPRRQSPSAATAARSRSPNPTSRKLTTDGLAGTPRPRARRPAGPARPRRGRRCRGATRGRRAPRSRRPRTGSRRTRAAGTAPSRRGARGARSRTPPAGRQGRTPWRPFGPPRGAGTTSRSPTSDVPTNSAYASSSTTTGAARPSASASARRSRRSAAIAPAGSGNPVGLFGLHSQTTAAPRAARRTAGRSIAYPFAAGRRGTAMGHGGTLLGQDAVHRVGRRRDDRAAVGREECLRDEVEDLVGAGTHEQLVAPDPVRRGGGVDQAAIVRRRVLGDRAPVDARSQEAQRDVRRRRRRVEVEADDPAHAGRRSAR